MLTCAKKLTMKNQSQLARLPFHIVWPSGAARLVKQVVCHHETSPKLKLELKKLQYHVLIAYCVITLRSMFHSSI